jgi:hypothetical protein
VRDGWSSEPGTRAGDESCAFARQSVAKDKYRSRRKIDSPPMMDARFLLVGEESELRVDEL